MKVRSKATPPRPLRPVNSTAALVFLDIEMPGRDGLAVLDRLNARTRGVIVTAFEEYAVEAFDTAAVDYLLKPVTAGRLDRSLIIGLDTIDAIHWRWQGGTQIVFREAATLTIGRTATRRLKDRLDAAEWDTTSRGR